MKRRKRRRRKAALEALRRVTSVETVYDQRPTRSTITAIHFKSVPTLSGGDKITTVHEDPDGTKWIVEARK